MEAYTKSEGIEVKLTNKNQLSFLEKVRAESVQTVFVRHDDVSDITATLIERALKRGGLCLVPATPKTLYECISNFDKANMDVKDIIAWVNPEVQSTSFGCEYLVKKAKDIPDEDKEATIDRLKGMRTMKLRTCFTPIIIFQKSINIFKTLVHNQTVHNCGLMNTTRTASGALASNVITTDFIDGYNRAFLISRAPFVPPNEMGRTPFMRVLYHLLNTFTHEGSTILDVSAGKGECLYAALLLKRHYLGNEARRDRYKELKGSLDGFVATIPKDKKQGFVVF